MFKALDMIFKKTAGWFVVLVFPLLPVGVVHAQAILSSTSYRHYIDSFNADDTELYRQYIPNEKSWQFLSANIPLFDCPDKQLEQTYYFRWWTYRKHIKQTPAGFVITEFLPNVPWAGKYNTINCASLLHIYEGSWLHDRKFIDDYERFWLKGGGAVRSYSFPVADAMLRQAQVTNSPALAKSLLPELVANYEAWEKENLDKGGLFWQVDDRDGMEMSIGGMEAPDHAGYRATINSYMYGDARAIATIARLAGNSATARLFNNKASMIRQQLQKLLWDKEARFFKVLPKTTGARLCDTRELHGYTPWFFNLPDSGYSSAWQFLMDQRYFFAPYGPTTAEQASPRFSLAYEGHECQWNGPSWPLSTSITLTAMANLLNNYQQGFVSRDDYFKLFRVYANSQQRTREDGKRVPWIDENLHPFTGDWISRTRLKTWDNGSWSPEKGGVERGKDYNHSSFADLLISGLIGLRPALGNRLVVNPLLPAETWAYFCLDDLAYHGKRISILYDRTGERYHRGKGFFIFVDGRKAGWSADLKKMVVMLSP
jgi:hypothetical protein